MNSIWVGSENVVVVDVLRALTREPAAVAAFTTELDLARGAEPQLDAAITRAESALHVAADSPDPATAQMSARALAEQLATTLQACLLTRLAPAYLAEAFVASRLASATATRSAACPAARWTPPHP